MEDSIKIYTLYSENGRNLAVYMSAKEGNIREAKVTGRNIEDLVKKFFINGLRISSKDVIQTISPIIVNEFAPKPWGERFGREKEAEKGGIVSYGNLTQEELNHFHGAYLVELSRDILGKVCENMEDIFSN